MENLQLQYAYSWDLPRPVADDEDDPVVGFCLDSTEEGLLYTVTQAGTVECLERHGKKVRRRSVSQLQPMPTVSFWTPSPSVYGRAASLLLLIGRLQMLLLLLSQLSVKHLYSFC